jgi:integrase
MRRLQRGSLRKEARQAGLTWTLRYYVTRQSDGKRVEHKVPIGLVRDLTCESAAWLEVERQQLLQQINREVSHGAALFSDIAYHYLKTASQECASSTAYVRRHIVDKFLVPRWGRRIAVSIRPLEVEEWLKALHTERNLSFPTCAKVRSVMACAYKHAQRHGLVPRNQDSNPMTWVRCKSVSDYEPIILTPAQAFTLASNLPPLERTLTLLAAATGLRISECLGLKWGDLDFQNGQIKVRRTWVGGQIGRPKTTASAQPVVMGPVLAQLMRQWQNESPYSNQRDWIFPSCRLRGRKPRTGSVMAHDYLRPAAARMGILELGERCRFGFHNLRHSLASYLVTQTKTDIKTVQSMLRHARVRTTLDLYTHAVKKDGLEAQNLVMEAMKN